MNPLLRERMLRDGAVLGGPGETAPRSFGDPAREAAAAMAGCVVADRSSLGRIRLRGKDRNDFLHRLSTHDINALKPGEGTLTALLTPKGRILDLLHALSGDDELLLITSAGMGERVRVWLDGYLFREEVVMEDAGRLACLGLYGTGAESLLSRVAGGNWRDLPLTHHRPARVAGSPVRGVRTLPLATAGFLLLGEADADLALWETLLQAGAVPAGSDALERLRIAAGVPERGKELTEDYNPWEAGLDAAISLEKGCYLGQEIVARLHTYRKIRRRLAGILLEGPDPADPGASILAGGQIVGAVTSSAPAPDPGATLVLGFLTLAAGRPGETVVVQSGGQRRPGRVVPLPFLERIS